MEQVLNIPIQMISCCSTAGNITPMRFRFENPDHTMETVNVDSVLAHKDVSYNGINEMVFTCQATINGIARLFTLKYNIRSHKWIMFRMLA